MKRWIIWLALMVFTAMGVTAQAQTPVDLVDTAESDGRFNLLVTAVRAAQLEETLRGTGPYTLFAPTDQGFTDTIAAMGMDTQTVMDDTNLLTNILLYHVVPGTITSDQLTDGARLTSVQGSELVVNVANEAIMLNNAATVLEGDLMATNGVIHVLDAVLMPPVDSLTTAVPAPTVVVPTEAATLPAVQPTVPAATVAPATAVPTNPPAQQLQRAFVRFVQLAGDATIYDVYLDAGAAPFMSLDRTQASEWRVVTAGVHTVVLAPPGGGLGAPGSGEFTINLPGESWHTIAIIGSAASNQIELALVPENTATPIDPAQARITLFHGAGTGPVDAGFSNGTSFVKNLAYTQYAQADYPASTVDLVFSLAGTTQPLVSAGNLTLIGGMQYFIAAANRPEGPTVAVIATDQGTINALQTGTAIVVPPANNQVAANPTIPPAEPTAADPAATAVPAEPTEVPRDLVDTLSADGRFVTLTTALKTAALEETLRGGTFTVFAPTDDAFAALPADTITALVSSPAAMSEVLLYHVVAGTNTLESLTGQQTIATVNGAEITITVDDEGKVLVNDSAQIIVSDVVATNGLIHIIDVVLLPPTE